jgi:hypothetical protein
MGDRVGLLVDDRAPYPSDVTDAQWAVVEPFLLAWKAKHPSVSGHQGRYELREIVNAIFYQNRTGCQWAWRRRHRSGHPRPVALPGAGEGGPSGGSDRGSVGHPVDPGGQPRSGGHDRQGRGQARAWALS